MPTGQRMADRRARENRAESESIVTGFCLRNSARAEGAPLRTTYDDGELLARAAALTAPLPPMPIANVAVTAAAPDETAAAPQAHGWVVRTAELAADDLAQLFGRLPFGGSKTAAPAQTGSGE